MRSIRRLERVVVSRVANRIDGPVLVLLYHAVARWEVDPYSLAVTPSNFRRHMEYLRDRFPVARFDEEWARVRRPSVVVTFDDGYANNLGEALPILEELGVPATFFVTTEPVEQGGEFWWDRMAQLALRKGSFPVGFDLRDARHGGRWRTGTPAERRQFHGELVALMKRVDAGRRRDWLEQVRSWAGAEAPTRDSHRPMTVDELRALAESPLVTVGAHGVTHTALACLETAEQRREMASAKAILERWLEREVSVFAYPYGGRRYYTRESTRLCREAGFRRAAAAGFPGQAHRWTDPYRIPRQMILDWPVEIFSERISELWTA